MTRILSAQTLTIAAVVTTLLAAAPAQAITVEFFEGNNCTQKMLGGFNLNAHVKEGKSTIRVLRLNAVKVGGITTFTQQPWNDEARSMRITSNWRNEREPKQGDIAIYDSPQASKEDDWVRVVVRDATQIPTEGICVRSFERNFDRNGIYLERHPNNGLDGKVSYIISRCEAACRSDLTPDPNPPKLVIVRKPVATPTAKPKYVVTPLPKSKAVILKRPPVTPKAKATPRILIRRPIE